MTNNIDKVVKKTKSTVKDYFKKIWEIIRMPEMGLLPGQLAFSMILSLVPIITFACYIASLFNFNTENSIEVLNSIIPGGASYLIPTTSTFVISFGYAIIFILMFYIATNGCNSIIMIANQIYGIKNSNWGKRRIKAILMTLVIVVLIVFLLIVPIFGNKIVDLLSYFGFNVEFVTQYSWVIKYPLVFLILFLFIKLFYKWAPDEVRDNSHLEVGAVFTTIGWFVITILYSNFATNMTTYNIIYGALANIGLLMAWLYAISFIFVFGLALNYGEELEYDRLVKTGAIKIIKD